MSHILYIGNYYPLSSIESVFTEFFVEELNQTGNDMFLLSKSWCEVTEHTFFGTAESLGKKRPFKKKYYLDPLQVAIQGKPILNCYLGLACKIIETEHIDCIFFSENMEYSPIVELIKNRFEIPCYLLLYNMNSYPFLMDNYIYPYAAFNLSQFDGIFTHSFNQRILTDYFSICQKKIMIADPIRTKEKQALADRQPIDNLYLLFFNKKHIIEDILNQCHIIKERFSLLGSDIIISSFNDADNIERKCCKLPYHVIDFKSIPPHSYVLHEDLLAQKCPSFCTLFTLLSCGLYPVITQDHYAEIIEICEVDAHFFDNGYVALKKLHISNKSISDYFQTTLIKDI